MTTRKEAFETRFFRSAEEAEKWLRQRLSTFRFVMATYRLRPDSLDEAKVAIRDYVEHVRRAEFETFSYQCFQSEIEPTQFVHLMSFTHEGAEAAHITSPLLKTFSEKLFPFCIEGPTYETLRLVSSPS